MPEQEVRFLLASRLREARARKSYTAKEVGELVGKSEKTVAGWEKGRGQPDADTLFKLCSIYGITTMDYFFPSIDSPYDEILAYEEKRLLSAYRNAEETARQYAIEMLESHPMEKLEEKQA